MIGFGTVGQGVYRMLDVNQDHIAAKALAPIEVTRIGIRDKTKPRSVPSDKITDDVWSIVEDPEIDIVVELIGGLTPAEEIVSRALRAGKHVITANKELIAKRGRALLDLAVQKHLDLRFEGAVGGGIPILQPMQYPLSGNRIHRISGIVNGTTNYILTKMREDRAELSVALQEAQHHGFAEADPTSDVDGYDAQYKIAILASVASGKHLDPDSVYREGIRHILRRDIEDATELGFRIKLLASAEFLSHGVLARVHPVMIPLNHRLGGVEGVYNGVWVMGNFVGDLTFVGRGAGGDPTASAVIGDLVDEARSVVLEGAGYLTLWQEEIVSLPITELRSRYFLRFVTTDAPYGVEMFLRDHGLGVERMMSRMKRPGVHEVVLITSECPESEFQEVLHTLCALESTERVEQWLRVEM